MSSFACLEASRFHLPHAPIARFKPNTRASQFGVKDGFVSFDLDPAHVLHAAHVVNAVHFEPPCGLLSFPTPTIESRVTKAWSCSSVIPSVPDGRSGRTR